MKIGIALFAYNRDEHLSRTLEGLKENRRAEKLYIFQDGLKCEEHRQRWEKTREIIENIDWCEKQVHYSDQNRGVAKSIVAGVHCVLEENDAVVVLEDDCIPAPDFIHFMYQCLEKYQNNTKIYSVSGYAWSIGYIDKMENDVYFGRRISSFGWGTWKNRWQSYVEDTYLLEKIMQDEECKDIYETWGSDLGGMLEDRKQGKNDSWAVYWALKVIENKGYCVNSREQFIKNIGFDGTGVHSGIRKDVPVLLSKERGKHYMLPESPYILEEYAEKFKEKYSKRRKIIIWGTGRFYQKNEKKINMIYEIKAFIDRNKSKEYNGIPVVEVENIGIQIRGCSGILIMVQDIKDNFQILKQLLSMGIPNRKIMLGYFLYGSAEKVWSNVQVLPDGRVRGKINSVNLIFRSADEFYNVSEVFCKRNYLYDLNNGQKDIIIDIGMNIGDSVLFFLNRDNVKKVYGFEPFQNTFLQAKENIEQLNNYSRNKFEIYPYGISDKDEKREICYNAGMSCGQSTIFDYNQKAYQFYMEEGYIEPKEDFVENIQVKKASDILEEIISINGNCNIVLKMDCEGEEYAILDDLNQSGLIREIDFVMLEWHYRGKNQIIKQLLQNQFFYWAMDKSENMGIIYARNIRK